VQVWLALLWRRNEETLILSPDAHLPRKFQTSEAALDIFTRSGSFHLPSFKTAITYITREISRLDFLLPADMEDPSAILKKVGSLL
jgi:hypothetical protein